MSIYLNFVCQISCYIPQPGEQIHRVRKMQCSTYGGINFCLSFYLFHLSTIKIVLTKLQQVKAQKCYLRHHHGHAKSSTSTLLTCENINRGATHFPTRSPLVNKPTTTTTSFGYKKHLKFRTVWTVLDSTYSPVFNNIYIR